jgi:hypothetical protein
MSTENEELFEGLQIMSPEELEKTISPSSEETPEGETGVSGEGENEFFLKPVAAETGDDDSIEKTITTKEETNESTSGRNETIYKALLKELVKEGVITAEEAELDELPGNFDTIKSLVNKTVEENFKAKEENWKKSLPSEKKRFLEIEDAFDETDQAIMMAQRLEFLENLKESDVKGNEELQKQIYFEQLKAKNFSDQEAIEALEDAIAMNKLEEKAFKAIPELHKQSTQVVAYSRQQKEAKTAAQVEAQNKAFENLIANIETRESFVDGLNLNKVTKDKLKSNIITPVYKDKETGREYNSLMYKQQRNPVEFEMLINYYDTLGLFNLDKQGKFKPDISKLKAVAKTAAINDLDKIISAEEQRGVGRNTSVETSKKTEGILNMLDRAFKTNK